MINNIHYCIASFLLLAIVSFYYYSQNKLHTVSDYILMFLSALELFALGVGFFSSMSITSSISKNVWFSYLINILTLVSIQLFASVFLLYIVINSSNSKLISNHKKRNSFFIFLPFIISASLTIVSPLTHWGVFYIDENYAFQFGQTHFVIQVVLCYYAFAIAGILLKARNNLTYTNKVFALIYLACLILLIFIPSITVKLLINTIAIVIFMSYSLQSPNVSLDPNTGLLNRTAFTTETRNLFEQKDMFSALFIQPVSLSEIEKSFSDENILMLIHSIGIFVQKNFNEFNAYSVSRDSFVLLSEKVQLNQSKINELSRKIPINWTIGDLKIPLVFRFVGFNSADCSNVDSLLTSIDRLSHDDAKENELVIMADQNFFDQYSRDAEVKNAVKRMIDQNLVEIYYQPIHNIEGQLRTAEALSRYTDEKIGRLTPDVFIREAEKNGLFVKLGEQILNKVCQFCRDNDFDAMGLQYVAVNLSMVQCLQKNIAEQIHQIVSSYGIDSRKICFEITESEAAVPGVQEHINQLCVYGYHLILDDFGTGYSNFTYLSEFNFSAIKIDKGLLWNAMKSQRQHILLSSIVDIIKSLGATIVCEGVETKEQWDTLKKLGVNLLQGYLFSKPIPSDQLIQYAAKNHVPSHPPVWKNQDFS